MLSEPGAEVSATPVTVGAVVLPTALITAVAATARLKLPAPSRTVPSLSATVMFALVVVRAVVRSNSTLVPVALAALTAWVTLLAMIVIPDNEI